MARNLADRLKKAQLVDSHGRSFPLYFLPQISEECAAVLDLQQTGFGIYQRSNYEKLSTIQPSDFNDEYHTYMLEAAAKYMLENKQIFTESQILSAISGCKQELLKTMETNSQSKFLQEREVEHTSKDNFTIRVHNTSTPKINKTNRPKSRQSLPVPLKKTSDENSRFQMTSATSTTTNIQRNLTNFSQVKQKILPPQNSNTGESPSPVPKRTLLGNPVKSGGTTQSDLKKIPKVVYNCVVTCINKPNCIWVRDTSNDEIFTKVYNMANEEATQQTTALKPWHTDKIYLAQDDESWFRCKIVKHLPLTVIFLDYGNVSQVDEVRDISEELAKIPSLAVRITFKISEYKPVLEEEITIRVFMQNDDGTYLVNVLSHSNPSKSIKNPETTVANKPLEIKQYTHRKNYLTTLRNGLRVIIIHEENNNLYLRCFDGIAKLKQLEDAIKEHSKDLQKVDAVYPNQCVLYRDRIDNEIKRVLVQQIKKNNVEIEYIDYIKTALVDVDFLYKTTKDIASAPITHLPGKKLFGFTNKDFGIIERQVIKQSIESRKEYKIILNSDDSLDLDDGSGRLSDLLQNNGRIALKDIQAFKPTNGLNAYLCGHFISSSDFSVVSTVALKDYQSDVFQTDVSTETYSPLINEACLALYDGDYWYRCIVLRILSDEYEVLFVDFGNMERIEKKNIRKANEETWKIPALALPCRLTNLPKNAKIEEKLKQLIRIGEIYEVQIKDISNGKYNAEIPAVYEKLKAL